MTTTRLALLAGLALGACSKAPPDAAPPAALHLRDAGAVLVGIDSYNVDDVSDGERPVHSVLLAAEIPIVEHLTGLAALPRDGFTFTAVPPKIEGAGTFTVRAYATLA